MSRSIKLILTVFAGLLTMITASGSAQTSPPFVVSVNPSAVTIAQGGSVTMTVTTVVDGRPAFEFSFAGLPAGVIAQTRSGRAGANTIVLTALPTAIIGSYSVDVTATTGNSSRTQTFTLHVKSMPPIQWEYHVEIAGTAQQFEAAANALGQQGWELVSMAIHAEEIIGVFKREKL
jgi:hypothetical protein